jgi:hypothetical protein
MQALMEVAGFDDYDDRIEAKISERLERQTILNGKNSPVLFVIIDEAVLRRPVGGNEVMSEQLEHLIKMAARSRITIQVVPGTVGAYPGANGPIVLMSLRNSPEIGYLENALGGLMIDGPEDVAKLAYTFNALRAEALPRTASVELMRKVMETWI